MGEGVKIKRIVKVMKFMMKVYIKVEVFFGFVVEIKFFNLKDVVEMVVLLWIEVCLIEFEVMVRERGRW